MADRRTINSTRLAAARLRAAEVQPFLALALYALTPVPSVGRGTFAVDEHWRLYVDPATLEEWTVEENAGVLLHEVGHLVRDHAGRARSCGVGDEEHAHLWNLAGDAEINDDLRSDRVKLPGRHVMPESLGEPRGRAAEYYYDRLVQGVAKVIEGPDCGSGCHGNDDPGLASDIGELPGLGTIEALLLRRRVAEQVLAAAKGQPGSVAGGWERWADAWLRPQVDWRRLFTAAVRGSVASVAGLSDYSYRRIARRRMPRVVLPAMEQPLPIVAIVVDTSGSVDDASLNVALSEVRGCLRSLGVRRDLLTVLAADTVAHKVAKPGGSSVQLVGGGGTDMRVGIAAALASRPKPNVVVVLTDGFTPWPAERPPAAVVVGLLQTADASTAAPPPAWARVVHIPVAAGETPSR